MAKLPERCTLTAPSSCCCLPPHMVARAGQPLGLVRPSHTARMLASVLSRIASSCCGEQEHEAEQYGVCHRRTHHCGNRGGYSSRPECCQIQQQTRPARHPLTVKRMN